MGVCESGSFSHRFRDGECLVGKWLMQAQGTRYKLMHEPFVAFDLMVNIERDGKWADRMKSLKQNARRP
jgi:hypothetical protein